MSNTSTASGLSCRTLFEDHTESKAAALVRHVELGYAALFETTGYQSYAAFEERLRQNPSPHIQKALQLIDNDQLQIVVRAHSPSRDSILAGGIRNIHQTGTSSGLNSTWHRNRGEAKLVGFEVEKYIDLDADLKPKYGTIRANPESGIQSTLERSKNYGDDLYVLKLKNIENRLTFYPEDSLNNERMDYLKTFVPWSYRLLMVPFMFVDLRGSPSSFESPTNFMGFRQPNKSYGGRFWESEIFGKVSIEDVQEFDFTQTPPAGDFLKALRERGIKIKDARQFPPVEWHGDQ